MRFVGSHLVIGVGVLAISASACTSLLGDYSVREDALDSDASTQPTPGQTDDAGLPGDDRPDAKPNPPPPGCADQKVDAEHGIFVESSGVDDTACGSTAAPCKTIKQGLERAKLMERSIVYIGRGTYVESVNLVKGIELQGGWDYLKPDWKPICVDGAATAVTIAAPGDKNITIMADALDGKAKLKTLTIKSKEEGRVAAGESIYGVFARGLKTELTLDDVNVEVVRGGNGATGSTGSTGAAAGTGCNPGNAATGASGSQGAGGGIAVFGPAGFVPTDGQPGASSGGAGAGGAQGPSGPCQSGCFTYCERQQFGNLCLEKGSEQVCGGAGRPGCGGGGGGPGGGGHGGGSSVAIFVSGAQVDIVKSALRAGNGGAGGLGGAGGPGASGGAGAVGFAAQCGTGCQACSLVGTSLAGGSAGSNGGTGGVGGHGGGGGAGSSFAVVQGTATGKVSIDQASTLRHGLPGTGQNGGADGRAGDTWQP